MHTICNSRNMKTLAAALLVATFGPAGTGYAQTTPPTFSASATSVEGMETQTTGIFQSTKNWGPDDQSTTSTIGSNDEPSPSITETNNGVEDYQSVDDDNSTDAGSGNDQADAASTSGSGSALGGLVTWNNLSIGETCLPDSGINNRIDCTVHETFSDLRINGQSAIQGSFGPATSIPVAGNIPDPDCPLGVVSFEGNLVLDDSIINTGTEQGSDTEIAMQITGTATCKAAGLIPLYTQNYNEQIGVLDINYSASIPVYSQTARFLMAFP